MAHSGASCILLILGCGMGSFATSCHEAASEKQLAKPAPPSAATDSIRQRATWVLARRLYWYHHDDSLETIKPGSTNKKVVTINNHQFAFKTRKELRADLNRVLDSMRRTGPLRIGNHAEGTDTVPAR